MNYASTTDFRPFVPFTGLKFFFDVICLAFWEASDFLNFQLGEKRALQYTPFGFGTVPPAVSIVSLESMATYVSSDVSLNFCLNKPATWVGYSLDGKDNITIAGNTTVTGLASGLHNITVYAKDEFENTGASETISFSVEEPFPTALVAVASAASVVIVGVGLLVYFKKRKR